MMEDLSNHFIRIHSILSIIVDKEYSNAKSPNVMDCRLGRSNHSYINIISIPRITNELERKLYELKSRGSLQKLNEL